MGSRVKRENILLIATRGYVKTLVVRGFLRGGVSGLNIPLVWCVESFFGVVEQGEFEASESEPVFKRIRLK